MTCILLVGAGAGLPRELAAACERRDLAFVTIARDHVMLSRSTGIAAVMDHHAPWLVVDTGGDLGADALESVPRLPLVDHVGAAELLARACAARRIQLVMLSTDQVFDGCKTVPYDESDEPRPLGSFGAAKLDVETRVLACHPRCMVVRTGHLFGGAGASDFISATLRQLDGGHVVHAACDEIGSPTYARDLADACLDLAIDGERGIWHLANTGESTLHQLACAVAEIWGHDTGRIVGVARPDRPRHARRPAYAALTSRRGGPLPSLADAIARFHNELVVEAP